MDLELESDHEIEPRTGILECPDCSAYYDIDKIEEDNIRLIGLNREAVLDSFRKQNLI